MSAESRHIMKRVKNAAVLFAAVIFLASCGGHTQAQMQKETLISGGQAMKPFVDRLGQETCRLFAWRFFIENTKTGIDKATAQMYSSENAREYKLMQRIMFANGFRCFENVNVHIYPIEGEDVYIALIEYDMAVDGIDTVLSGTSTFFIGRREDGSLCIDVEPLMSAAADNEKDYGRLNDKISDCLYNSEEIQLIIEEADRKYSSQILECPEATVWAKDVGDKRQQAGGLPYLAQEQLADGEEITAETGSAHKYIVENGDSLWKIADAQLGSGALWGRIYDANRGIIGDNPNLLYAGEELIIN